MSILSTAIGEELFPLVKPPVTGEQLQRYANASGDHNPIHLDEEAAHRVGLDSVIAGNFRKRLPAGPAWQSQWPGFGP